MPIPDLFTSSTWLQEFRVYVDDVEVDWFDVKLNLVAGETCTLELNYKYSWLIGNPDAFLALEYKPGAEGQGLVFDPPLGQLCEMAKETTSLSWSISTNQASDGPFVLQFALPKFDELPKSPLLPGEIHLPVIESLTCDRPDTYTGYEVNAWARVIRSPGGLPFKGIKINWRFVGNSLPDSLTDADGVASVTFMTSDTGEHDLVATQASGVPGSKTQRITVKPLQLARVSALSANPSTLRVGESASIEAKVVTLVGTPIEGRKVEWIQDAGSEPFATTYTKADGEACISFTATEPGSTQIKAEVRHAEGTGPSSRTVTLTILE